MKRYVGRSGTGVVEVVEAIATSFFLAACLSAACGLAAGDSNSNSVVWCGETRWETHDLRAALQQWNATTGEVVYGGTGPEFHEVSLSSTSNDDVWAGSSSSGWILDDLRQDAVAQCDIYLTRSSAVPLFVEGYLKELSAVRADPRFEWSRIAYPARAYVGEFGRFAVSLPLEFQFPMLLYRRDLAFYPPADWEDLLDMAQRLNSTDMNHDGIPDFGFCVDPAAHFAQLAFGIVASIMKTDLSIFTSAMYDIEPQTGKLYPNFDTPGYAYALSIARRMWQLSRGDNWRGSRTATSDLDWNEGRCAFYLTWAAEGGSSAELTTYIRGRSGFAMMPGSTKVYSRKEGRLENCTASTCPYSRSTVSRPINQITFEVGSKRLLVRRNVSNMNAVMDVMAAVVKAMPPWKEGIVPSRDADFLNFSEYTAHGWDAADAYSYLAAVQNSLSNGLIHTSRLYPTVPANFLLFRKALEKALRVGPTYAPPYDASDEQIVQELAQDVEDTMLRMGYTLDTLMPGWLRNMSYNWTLVRPDPPESQGNRVWIWIAVLLLLLAIIVACVAALSHIYRRGGSASKSKEDESPVELSVANPTPAARRVEIEITWPTLPSQGPEINDSVEDDTDSGSSCSETSQGSSEGPEACVLATSSVGLSGVTSSSKGSTTALRR